MMNQHITYEKQCVMCKLVAGVFMGGYGTFHAWRARDLWYRYTIGNKIFNVAAVSFVYLLAALNFNAAF